MVRATAEILNAFNSVIFMITSFIMLHNEQYGRNTDHVFFAFIIIVTFTGYFILSYFKSENLAKGSVIDMIGQSLFMICSLAFLTPLLQSLTVKISDDTIVSLIGILILIHLSYFDYQIQDKKYSSIVNHPISLNSIFFATILLASRLSRNNSAFVLLLQSLSLFSYGTFFRQEMRRINRVIYEAFTLIYIAINFCMILNLHYGFALIYICFQAFIAFVTPLLFIYAYRYKNDVRGAWDIPVIKDYGVNLD